MCVCVCVCVCVCGVESCRKLKQVLVGRISKVCLVHLLSLAHTVFTWGWSFIKYSV